MGGEAALVIQAARRDTINTKIVINDGEHTNATSNNRFVLRHAFLLLIEAYDQITTQNELINASCKVSKHFPNRLLVITSVHLLSHRQYFHPPLDSLVCPGGGDIVRQFTLPHVAELHDKTSAQFTHIFVLGYSDEEKVGNR